MFLVKGIPQKGALTGTFKGIPPKPYVQILKPSTQVPTNSGQAFHNLSSVNEDEALGGNNNIGALIVRIKKLGYLLVYLS